MGYSDQIPEGVKTIPLGGMDERNVPEYQKEDLSFVMGFCANRDGQLIKIPGKKKITRMGVLPILAIAPFGDQILVENSNQLVSFTNAEMFGGTETSPDPSPDSYVNTVPIEDENLNMVILKYRVAANTQGSAITASTWTRVPFTNEDADSGGNCVLDGSGNFTLTNAVYPVNVRLRASVCFRSSGLSNTVTTAKLLLETNTGSPGSGSFVDTGLNAGGNSSSSANITENCVAQILTRFSLAASTQYRLCLFVNQATTFGTQLNAGIQEVYAQLEMYFEETLTPIADGVHLAATYGVSITTASGKITATA